MASTPQERAVKAADLLAETVRKLNHLTLRDELDPPDVCRVVRDVAAAVERLPQLLGQLERHLANATTVYSDRGDEYTAVDVRDTVAGLARARVALPLVADELREAKEAAFHLGCSYTDNAGSDS